MHKFSNAYCFKARLLALNEVFSVESCSLGYCSSHSSTPKKTILRKNVPTPWTIPLIKGRHIQFDDDNDDNSNNDIFFGKASVCMVLAIWAGRPCFSQEEQRMQVKRFKPSWLAG
eukprot:2084888-Amphidinium_carterae.1